MERSGYEEVIKWIYDLSLRERTGMRLGLKSIAGLCSKLGDPQDSYSSVHIAGTNGKGSVAHMISAVLSRSGRRTGLYTSPHLQTFCERVRVDAKMITEEEIVAIARVLFPNVEDMAFEPTFFDVTTALAFLHFKDNDIDRAVVEVGLGGRLDSTNILKNVEVCVLTNVGLEHTDVLGDDIASIAKEKASIFKEGSVAVVGDMPPEARQVVESLAQQRLVKDVRRVNCLKVLEEDLEGMHVIVEGRLNVYDLKLGLLGRHQAKNAALAITALEAMEDPPTKGDIEDGLNRTIVPGRLETVATGPQVIIDGAHNPTAGEELAIWIRTILEDRKIVLVVGMMEDKDVDGFMGHLAPLATHVVTTKARSDRAVPPDRMVASVGDRCGSVTSEPNVKDALAKAIDLAGSDGMVLATGSFYVAGEVRQLFEPVELYL